MKYNMKLTTDNATGDKTKRRKMAVVDVAIDTANV
jgi:hypothetical protein